MSEQNKLKQNLIYNALYQVLILLIPLITMPYLTRVLSVEQLGINGYTLSVIQVFILISFFGINNYGSREIAYTVTKEERNKQFWAIWSVQLIWTFLAFIIFTLLNHFLFDKYNTFLFIQSFLILVNGLEVSWLFVGLEELRTVVIRNTLIKICSILMIFVFVKDSNDFTLYIVINLIMAFLGNLVLVTSLRKYIFKSKINIKNVLLHMRKSSVFLLPQLSILVYTTLDKTILGTFSTMTEVGYYDQSQKIVRMAIGLVSSVGAAIMPRMTIYIKENRWSEFDKLFYRAISSVSLISFYIVSMIISIAPSFVIWFFGPEYKPVISLMQIAAFIGVFIPIATLLWNTVLIPMKQDKIAIKSAIYAALISVILNVLFIPKYGAIGAVITLVMTELFGLSYRIYNANKYYKLSQYRSCFFKYGFISTIVVILVNRFTQSLVPSFFTTMLQGIMGTVLFLALLILSKDKFFLSLLGGFLKNDKKNI